MSESNEEWEWTKYLLTKSLFEDMPRPTFQENQSSSDDSFDDSSFCSPSPPSFFEYELSEQSRSTISEKHSSLSENEDSPSNSPLPPSLIIEHELNKHDESEEFYKQLEIRMKDYYRILFFEQNYDKSTEEYETVDQLDELSESNSIPDYGYGSPLQITYICNEEVEPDRDVDIPSDEENEDSCPRFHEEHSKENNVTRAQIHREASDIDLNRSMIYENSVKSPILEPTCPGGDRDNKGNTGNTILEENIGPDNDPDNVTVENKNIEMMRGLDIHQSHDSIVNDPYARDIRFSSDAAININLADAFQSVQMEVIDEIEAQSHFDENILSFSTPKSGGRKRKSSEQIPMVNKKTKYLNMATQTSIEDDTINPHAAWDILRSNFFVGIPRIFNLCSCKNHVCAR